MKNRFFVLTAALMLTAQAVHAQTSSFTYQGRLDESSAPANGSYDLQFTLFDAVNAVVAGPITVSPVAVTNGLFSVSLNFGANAFNGQQRSLQIGVRTNGSLSSYSILNPKQPITSAPYAVQALNAANAATVTGTIPATNLTGTISDDRLSANIPRLNSSPIFSGGLSASTFTGSGAGLTNLNAAQLTGTVPDGALNNAWKLSGNSGTTPGTHFIGTTDGQPIEFKVGARVMRLESAPNSPNMIVGAPANTAVSGTFGSTIAGGGFASLPNTVSGQWNAIGGGRGNSVSGAYSVIDGGDQNQASHDFVSIGGGFQNSAFGMHSVIGGGAQNTNTSQYSTISGGNRNVGGYLAAIGGGYRNVGNGSATVIAGGTENLVNGNGGTIGGGTLNAGASDYGVIGGGYSNTNGGLYSTIAGGTQNVSSTGGSVGGGGENQAGGSYSAIPGGRYNSAQGQYSLAAGQRAKAMHNGAFVWGDSSPIDFTSTANNQFLIRAMGGVGVGTAAPLAPLSVQGIGTTNGNTAFSGDTVAHFRQNSGGTAIAIDAQTGFESALLLAENNAARWSMRHVGSSGKQLSFYWHGNGGSQIRMILDTNGNLNVVGSVGQGSDKNSKTNFAQVNARDILERVVSLPISTWAYKHEPQTAHIGPMSQDFYAAFEVGADDKHITTIDQGGVALAAIQGLNQKLEEKEAEINRLREKAAKVDSLENRIAHLEKIITRQAPQD